MKRFLKKFLPQWVHYWYNRLVSRQIIKKRNPRWFEIDWKKRAKTATYEEWLRVYDTSWEHWTQPDLSELDIEKIRQHLNEEGSILDVGCGDGYLLSFLWNGKRKLYGIDLSKKAIELAKQRLKDQAELLVGTIQALPFQDNAFEYVVCTHTLEHVNDLKSACEELKRVTKKKLMVLVPVQEFLPYTEDYHLQFFTNENDLLVHFAGPKTVVTRYTVPDGLCAYQGDVFLLVWEKQSV
ncbi:MAG: class I SAM-dependent methyltransferase [bacterium]|nr:class I SAM-dependent methyltransferase [bacterium]